MRASRTKRLDSPWSSSTEARRARCRARGAPPASCSRPSSRRGSRELAFVEVRYRVKTWNALDSCMADGRAALDLVARPSLLVGFSMGGAVSIGIASHSDVTGVLGLAPWIPERLSLDGAPREAARRAPRLLGSLSARDPGCQRRELEAWLRARAGARRRGHVHADSSRSPWRRSPAPVRGDHAAATRARRGSPASSSTSRASRRRTSRPRAVAERAACRSAGARSRRGRASRASGS